MRRRGQRGQQLGVDRGGRPAPPARRCSRRASSAPGSSRSPRRRSCAPARRAPPAAAGAPARGGRRCRPRRSCRSCACASCSTLCADCRRQRGAGRVVQHRDGDVQARPRRAPAAPRSGAASRRGRGRPSPRGTGSTRRPSAASRAYSTDQPGSSTSTRVAGAQQGARDDVQRLRRADGGDDLLGRGADADVRPGGCASARRSRCSPAGSPYCSDERAELRAALTLRSALASSGRSSHSAGSVPSPGIGLRARRLEHAADQRGGADRAAGERGARRAAAPRRRRASSAQRSAHEEAALRARLDQALREQLVVGGDHRGRADLVPPRAFAHRGQPCAGREQALADALGEARGELVGQGAVGLRRARRVAAGSAAASSMACAGRRRQYSGMSRRRKVYCCCAGART